MTGESAEHKGDRHKEHRAHSDHQAGGPMTQPPEFSLGLSDVFRVNVVTDGGKVSPGLVFHPPLRDHAFDRILMFDNETGVSSWLKKDDGSEIPNYEAEDGDYSDTSKSGITWHQNK